MIWYIFFNIKKKTLLNFFSLFIVVIYNLKFAHILKNFTQSSMNSVKEIYARSHMQSVITVYSFINLNA